MSTSDYHSEGFDLDAIPTSQNNADNEVIYEIGGNACVSSPTKENEDKKKKGPDKEELEKDTSSPIFKSEECKQRGNDFFKKGDYLNSHDMYSDAIDACPGMKGVDIFKLKEDHELAEREKANQIYLRDTDRRRKTRSQNEDDEDKDAELNDSTEDGEDDLAPSEFKIPPHEYGTQLAVYYSNRAASLLHESRYDEAIQDCDIAILLNPKYTKAYIRRMTAYENTDQSEEALRDAKEALNLDPKNSQIRKHVNRLQKIEDERLEKLKEETMGKLKDLGNSILGNFGLSMDNFQAQQDPGTGSYNISFQN